MIFIICIVHGSEDIILNRFVGIKKLITVYDVIKSWSSYITCILTCNCDEIKHSPNLHFTSCLPLMMKFDVLKVKST